MFFDNINLAFSTPDIYKPGILFRPYKFNLMEDINR